MVRGSTRPCRRAHRRRIRGGGRGDGGPDLCESSTYGYDKAFLWFGLGQGLVILVLSQMLKAPSQARRRRPAEGHQGARDFRPIEMLRTPLFWILYVMFVLVAASGLVVTAQVAPIAKDYKIAACG